MTTSTAKTETPLKEKLFFCRNSSLFDRYYYYEQCMLINLTLVVAFFIHLFVGTMTAAASCVLRLVGIECTQTLTYEWLFYEFVSGKKLIFYCLVK